MGFSFFIRIASFMSSDKYTFGFDYLICFAVQSGLTFEKANLHLSCLSLVFALSESVPELQSNVACSILTAITFQLKCKCFTQNLFITE